MSTTLLVTGCKGQIGSELVTLLPDRYSIIGIDVDDADIRDYKKLENSLATHRPEAVIHTAAYTDVDGCETDPETAWQINALGTDNVARVCAKIGARLIYISTDYVFDGLKRSPYVEEDLPNPQTVYGKSKLEGERRIMESVSDFVILRTAWVYGIHGKNFPKTMIRLANKQIADKIQGAPISPIKVVDDQIGNPTWTVDIVRQIEMVLDTEVTGVFHSTAEGETSWFGFAQELFKGLSLTVDLVPCSTSEYPRPAPRPKYSSLENLRLKEAGINRMRNYRTALKEFLGEYGKKLNNEV